MYTANFSTAERHRGGYGKVTSPYTFSWAIPNPPTTHFASGGADHKPLFRCGLSIWASAVSMSAYMLKESGLAIVSNSNIKE